MINKGFITNCIQGITELTVDANLSAEASHGKRQDKAELCVPFFRMEDIDMLLGIPKILSPELLKVLAEMGHDDTLVIADGNFPAQSVGRNSIVIRCDGFGAPELLDAILKVFPLDTYVDKPVNLMEVVPGDNVETPIWDVFKEIIAKHDPRGGEAVGTIERFQFYEEARKAYAILATGESAQYANVMIRKGVVLDAQ